MRYRKVGQTQLIYILVVMSIILIIYFLANRNTNYNLNKAIWLENKSSSSILFFYDFYHHRKGGGYNVYLLKSVNPVSGEILGQYKHKNKRGSFKLLKIYSNCLYLQQGSNNFYRLRYPELDLEFDNEQLKKQILTKNTKIKNIYELKVVEGIFKITNNAGFNFWLDMETLNEISENKVASIQKYNYNQEYFDFWAKRQDSTAFKQALSKIQYLNNEYRFMNNYAVVSEPFYHIYLLDGDPRRQLLHFPQNDSATNLIPQKNYLKGAFLRNYRKKGDLPKEVLAIFTKKPFGTFILHQTEMDEENAEILLSYIDLEKNEEIYEINLSNIPDLELSTDFYPTYNWVDDKQLISVYYNGKVIWLISFEIHSGKLLWQRKIEK